MYLHELFLLAARVVRKSPAAAKGYQSVTAGDIARQTAAEEENKKKPLQRPHRSPAARAMNAAAHPSPDRRQNAYRKRLHCNASGRKSMCNNRIFLKDIRILSMSSLHR